MSLHCIKQLIHRKKIGNVCTFGKNTTIDSKAYFEGMNRLGENLQVSSLALRKLKDLTGLFL